MEAPGHAVGGLCAGLAVGTVAGWPPLVTLGAGMVAVVTSGSICGPDMDQRRFWTRLRGRTSGRLYAAMEHRRGTHSVVTAAVLTAAWWAAYTVRAGSTAGLLTVLAASCGTWLAADRLGRRSRRHKPAWRVARDGALGAGLLGLSTALPWVGVGLLAGWWSHLVLDYVVGRAWVVDGRVVRGPGIPLTLTCHHHGVGLANGGAFETAWTWLAGPALAFWLCSRTGSTAGGSPRRAARSVPGAATPGSGPASTPARAGGAAAAAG